MNVYVVETAKRLAQLGVEVDIFTRATASNLGTSVALAPGVTVQHVTAGPFEGLPKEDLPGQLCAVTAGVLRAEARRPEGWYDLIHSHYWLSGQVGWLSAERWNVPLVHTMHTMARVKNLDVAEGDAPEPEIRVIGEQQVVDIADRLIANTADEAAQLIDLYNADAGKVDVIHPGVDLETFIPRPGARERLGLPANAKVLLFVGRIQPLKAPDIVLKAAAELIERNPLAREELIVAVCGGPSGSGLARPTALIELADALGIRDVVRFIPPTSRAELADWYRAADLTIVPSYSESFGLVAVESQACGTPVVAARVGGLRTAVHENHTGLLVTGHNPTEYAIAIERALAPGTRETLAAATREYAEQFGWTVTADELLTSYSKAMASYQRKLHREGSQR